MWVNRTYTRMGNYPPGYGDVVFFQERRRYGCLSFLFDVFMLVVTAGWWLLWIIIREWRYSRR